ncbi:cyclopropane-fatty-acyl-phospholipid synthase [Parafrankia irregularis]|uniref:Cyclopropane-fatty-acyl-phospholipid synthase n=2 Tax=Frankiaceae TaxID=74712 RepID=A0A0S4QE98_9ACTN|nr:class I SAM-dependent methyltransferase [Parafrankia sp. CH37]CUU53593.1 cyclopropane-fatty-acyl-phospholipid synthase [Parafrankia irregularis]
MTVDHPVRSEATMSTPRETRPADTAPSRPEGAREWAPGDPRPPGLDWPPEVEKASRDLLVELFGTDPAVRVEMWDGFALGPRTSTRVLIRNPHALRRALSHPGELGFARAFVAGDIEIDGEDGARGDIFEALALRKQMATMRPSAAVARAAVVLAKQFGVRPPEPPPEEARLRGRLHSRARDAAAISHHYDVSNEFYRLVLGESMTYSCAVWEPQAAEGPLPAGLAGAQAAKHELVCRKLGLRPGERLLDVGCGWGSMVLHAARHHGVHAVGITISEEQAALARRRVAEAGLGDRIEIRLQDYREITDGPFDAISSVGMVEHVGRAKLPTYFENLFRLLRPGGRLLNHGISFPGDPAGAARRRPRIGPVPLPENADFLHRYVFPDGELHEIGTLVTLMQGGGFEVRHVENLREHYALTLRAWVTNLEQRWDEAVAMVGAGRARVWRLYMAGSALSFEGGFSQIHQVLGVRPDGGDAHQPLRPSY